MSSGWTTTAEAEFINSLCPVSMPAFPRFPGLSAAEQHQAKETFKEGFNIVRQTWHHRSFYAPFELNKTEQKVWLAVSMKTIRFSKLCEKIPRRVLREGQVEVDDKFGLPVLPPTGLDEGALSKGVRGLQEKGWLLKFESDPHPLYGVSSVYCPMDLQWAFETMVNTALDTLFPVNDLRRVLFRDFLWSGVEPLLSRPK